MTQEAQRINNFNKIQVKHQNTEMAKKVLYISCFNFVKITVVEKYYKILIFKTFFCNSSKTF